MASLVRAGGSNLPAPAQGRAVIGSSEPDAVGLGRYLEGGGVAGKIRYGGDRHIVLFGPNGSGKGMRLLVPNLLQMSGRSIFVIDPKGELAAMTAPYRRKLGHVIILNPFGVLTDLHGYGDLKSSGFNPLAGMNPADDQFNAQASLMADALVTVGGSDPHWDESARALLAALIMFEVIKARREGRVPTMARVRSLLCEPSSEGNYALDMPPYGLPATAMEMSRMGHEGLRNKASQFVVWNRETIAIASSAKRQTECLDDIEISRDLARNSFDFADMKKEPVTVYCILPPQMMQRHAKWLRLVLTSALMANLKPRLGRQQKILFMLDEFAALGHLQVIETVWSLVRGYGIQIMPIFQDMNQLRSLYKERWETFLGNAGAVATFAPNDWTSAEWFARRAGDTTDIMRSDSSNSGTSSTSSHSGGSSGSSSGSSVSYSPVKVPFLTPHQLFGMAEGFLLITLAGMSNIVPAFAPAFWQIEECMNRKRDNPYYAG